jgi:hypothetical protein
MYDAVRNGPVSINPSSGPQQTQVRKWKFGRFAQRVCIPIARCLVTTKGIHGVHVWRGPNLGRIVSCRLQGFCKLKQCPRAVSREYIEVIRYGPIYKKYLLNIIAKSQRNFICALINLLTWSGWFVIMNGSGSSHGTTTTRHWTKEISH